MGQDTKIQWAHHTFNPWRGCTKVAGGCKNCYADAQSKRNPGVLGIWGPKGTRVVASETAWLEPRKWNKAAAAAGERRRVFCASLADVFEDWRGPMKRGSLGQMLVKPYLQSEWGPEHWLEEWEEGFDKDPQGWQRLTMADVRRRLFELIDATPNLDWLLVTKRPENIRKMWLPREVYECGCVRCCDGEHAGRCPDCAGWGDTDGEECSVCDSTGECPYCEGEAKPPTYRDNVWLLTSIACQEDADRNIPELLKCRDLVPVLGVSAEPLIGPVQFNVLRSGDIASIDCLSGYRSTAGFGGRPGSDMPCNSLDWVIVGGESGPNARPYNIAWPREIIAQCREAGVPCFHKQLGENAWDDASTVEDWMTRGVPRLHTMAGRVNISFRNRKGGDPDEWPEDLRVREFPEVGR